MDYTFMGKWTLTALFLDSSTQTAMPMVVNADQGYQLWCATAPPQGNEGIFAIFDEITQFMQAHDPINIMSDLNGNYLTPGVSPVAATSPSPSPPESVPLIENASGYIGGSDMMSCFWIFDTNLSSESCAWTYSQSDSGVYLEGPILPIFEYLSQLTYICFSAEQVTPDVYTIESTQNLDGINLRWIDVSLAAFSAKSFVGGQFNNGNLNGTDFTGCDLTGADFSNATLVGTIFSGATLSNANFTGCDLTQAIFDADTTFSYTQEQPMIFAGASVPYSVIGLNWEWFDLTGANITGLPVNLSSQQAPLQASNATLRGLQNNLQGIVFQYAVLNEADLTGLTFTGADFTGAELRQALLNGATLDYCSVAGADLTGAQMGSIALLFSITDAGLMSQFELDLNNDNVTAVVETFSNNGVTLVGTPTITPSSYAPGRVWTVQDNQQAYTVRLESPVGTTLLSVYEPSIAATSLDHAFMMGATLTSAMMYSVNAPYVQLYNNPAQTGDLQDAVLENADLSSANLGSMDLSQARLYGTILDGAVLTNLDFSGAFFTASDTNRAASLDSANIQGANFTGAQLAGATLTNAAVSVSDPTDPTTTYGVWLFDSGPADPASYIDELNNAMNLFTLDTSYVSDLQPGPVNSELGAAFSSNGVTLSTDATISTIQDSSYWQITDSIAIYTITQGCDQSQAEPALVVTSNQSDVQPFTIPLSYEVDLQNGPVNSSLKDALSQYGEVSLSSSAAIVTEQTPGVWEITSSPTNYTLWLGLDDTCAESLSVRPSIPNLQSLFAGVGMALSWRAVITQQNSVWLIDNDSNNPFNAQMGYIQFNVVQEQSDGRLDLYGYFIRIERLSQSGESMYYNIVCELTTLETAIVSSTTCPNAVTMEGQSPGSVYQGWMRAVKPPTPPPCVPSPDGLYFCPQANQNADSKAEYENTKRNLLVGRGIQ